MPLYQYECESCKLAFEKIVPMKDAAYGQHCPDCQGFGTRRFVPPTCVSDCTLYRSDNTGGNQFQHPAHRNLYVDKAKAAGVTVEGKCYYPELASFQGDPEAWCGSADDIRRVATKKGYNVDGDVKVRARKEVEPEQGGISERLVNEGVARLQAENPGLSRKKAVEDYVNRHAPIGKKRIVKAKRKAKV